MRNFSLTFISIAFFAYSSFSQQTAQYSHFLYNYFAINPAMAGSKSCIDVKFGHRQQWVGFEGAPATSFANIHSILKKNKYSIEKKHALGVHIENDSYGPFSRAQLKLAYAYHFPISRDVLMSTGIFLGIEQFRFKASEVTLSNYSDNAINNNQSSFILPIITPGIFLQSKKWFGGISLQQISGNNISNVGTSETKLHNHFSLLGGLYIKKRRSDIAFIPNALLKVTKGGAPAFDVSALAEYKENFTFGFTYRNTDAIIGLLKFNVFNYLSVGYSFDFTTSKINQFSNNTHEIIIGINPCGNKKKSNLACPNFN